MEPVRLFVGTLRSDCNWIRSKMSHGFHREWMPQATVPTKHAVPMPSQRRTWIGGTERSAMAPKKSGERRAATADVANANGMTFRRFADSRTDPIGTNQDPKAIPWRKRSVISSSFSTHVNSRCKGWFTSSCLEMGPFLSGSRIVVGMRIRSRFLASGKSSQVFAARARWFCACKRSVSLRIETDSMGRGRASADGRFA